MSHADFASSLDYLMADMNSHPVHLVKYLKAIVLSAEIARTGRRDPDLDGFWREFFSVLSAPALAAALTLNQPDAESPARQAEIAEFFMARESACTSVLDAGT
jgi:hypothetical protein